MRLKRQRILKILLISSLFLILANKCKHELDVEVLVGDSETLSIKKITNNVVVKEVFADEELFDRYFCVIDEDMEAIAKRLSDCKDE